MVKPQAALEGNLPILGSIVSTDFPKYASQHRVMAHWAF
jgi:hypothetical protein